MNEPLTALSGGPSGGQARGPKLGVEDSESVCRIPFEMRPPYITPIEPPREGTRPATCCKPVPLTRSRGFMSSRMASNP